MVKVVLRSTVAAIALMAGFSHMAAAAPITSNWTPGNVGNWSGGAPADAVNWTHSQPPTPPSTQTFPNNNVNDTYSVNISGGSGSVVNLNTNVTIDALNVSGGDTLNIDNARNLAIVTGGNVTNNGAINVNSAGSVTGLNFLGSSTISGTGTITLGNAVNNRITQSSGGGIITNSVGHTIRGAGSVLTNIGGMNNAGDIIADQSNALILDPGADPFNNTGTLRAQDGAQLRLSAGTYNNAGGTIEADGPGSNVNLSSGVITLNGGTLATTNGGEIRSGANTGAILDGVTISAGSNVVQANSFDFRVQNGVTNNGTWSLNSTGSQTFIQFLGSQTLDGTGEVVMGNHNQNTIFVGNNADILTLGASQTIRGAGQLLLNAGGIVNNGAIRQQGSVQMTIDPGSPDVGGGANFLNNGTLRSEGTGGISFLGAIYQNAGQTIETTGGGDIRFASNAIELLGGYLTTSGGGVIRSTAGTGAIFDNVRLTTGSDIVQVNGEDIRIRNGITNDGTWSLNSTGSTTDIQFLGSQTLGGTGEVVMSDNLQNRIFVSSNADELTLASTQTIRGAGQLLLNAGGLTNDGTILQQGAAALVIDPGSPDLDGNGNNFINNGVLRSEGAGGLTLNGATYRNNTTIETTGGGDIRFASNAIVLRGGDLTTSGGGVVRSTAGVGSIFEGVTLTAGSDIVQINGEDLRIRDGITNDGTWSLNSTGSTTDIQFLGSQTLGGSGEVVMSDNVQNRIFVSTNADVVTLAGTQTIRGAGQLLLNAGGFVNNGTVLQQGAAAMVIDPGSPDVDGNGANFVNNSVLRSEGAGGLIFRGATYRNNTTIETTGGGDIRFESNAIVLRGGNLTTSGGGVVRSTAGVGSIFEGVTLTAGSDIVQINGEDLRIRDGMTNDGTWALNSTGSTTDIQFLGSQTLGGSGEIVMSDNIQNRIFASTNADVLTVGANQTIRGAGQILLNAGGVVNNGTVIADGAAASISIDAGTNFSNQGTMRASGAAGFDIRGGTEFTQAGGLVDIQSGSRIDMTFGDYVQTGGHTQVDGTLATVSASSNVNIQGGTFGGTGLVDFNGTGVHALNNTGGMITAGASPGVLTIQDGNFVQGVGGTFEFELDGFVAGVGHDLLNIVNGDADLGGDLSIVADQLFASTLSIGDQFEVVRLDSLGTFLDGDLVNGADVFDNIIINLGGLNFTQLFIGNSLFIEVTQANVQPPGVDPIPEPESMILMMLGLTAMLWMRRRRVTVH
tara:strand:+ start:637 stop:4350 length:3714 start_codon:yes stop_codon:yes gene_type:complete